MGRRAAVTALEFVIKKFKPPRSCAPVNATLNRGDKLRNRPLREIVSATPAAIFL
jgi:hypothetical protein